MPPIFTEGRSAQDRRPDSLGTPELSRSFQKERQAGAAEAARARTLQQGQASPAHDRPLEAGSPVRADPP